MSSTNKELSAADLIKRFREGKPMSADERRGAMGDRAKMWWEDTTHTVGGGIGSQGLGATMEESPVPRGRSQRISPESSIRGRSRSPSLNAGRRSGGGGFGGLGGSIGRDRFARDMDVTMDDDLDFLRQSHRSLGESRESALRHAKMPVRDEVEDPLFKSRTFGRSLDVDALIGNELQRLKEDVRKKEQATLRRLNSGSYGPAMSQSRLGSVDATNRQSTETLGSTGFLGLLKSDLRLDSMGEKKKKAAEEEAAAAVAQPDPLSADELNKKLEGILAELKKDLPPEPPKNTYLPEGIEETIPQITDKLDQELKQLTSIFNYAQQEAEAAERDKMQKEYEEKLREEGREEEKKKRLLEALDTPVYEPKDLLTVWKSTSYPTAPAPVASSSRRVSIQERDPLGDSIEEAEGLRRLQAKRHDAALVMQRAIDNELTSAEEIFHQMRHLRTNLGLKMHQVHALGDATATEMRVKGNAIVSQRGAARTIGEPLGSKYWGLEEYKEELEIRDFDGDIRKTFNPYPNLVHENIFKVAQAVESTLNVAMDILVKRLGHDEPTPEDKASSAQLSNNPTDETHAEEVLSSLEFEVSTSVPPSPTRDAAKRYVGNLLETAQKKEPTGGLATFAPVPQPVPTVNVKSELAAIDKLLGPEEKITYVNTTRSPEGKALAAGRFDRFLTSKQRGDAFFSENGASIPQPTIAIDPLRDVRQERKIFAGPPLMFQEEPTHPTALASAPPAPLSKPPTHPGFTYSTNPLPFTSALTPSSSRMQLNMSNNEIHLPTRPLEGTAISYMKSQQQHSMSSGSVLPKYNPMMNNENALNQKIPSSVPTPSSAASILEREEFLQRMRNMRQKIQTQH